MNIVPVREKVKVADIDLSGDVTQAVQGAYERGHPVTVAYVDEGGRPSMSIRGSTQVLNPTQIGFWARTPKKGLARAIASNPNVALLFFGSLPDGSKVLLNLRGKAHVDFSRNHEVYDTMSETEKKYDPDMSGVAVIVDVDSVTGMSSAGPFQQGAGS